MWKNRQNQSMEFTIRIIRIISFLGLLSLTAEVQGSEGWYSYPLRDWKWLPCPPCEDVEKDRPEFRGKWIRLDGGEVFFGERFEFNKPAIYNNSTAFVPCLHNHAIYQCEGKQYRVVKNFNLKDDIITFHSDYDDGANRFLRAHNCAAGLSLTAKENYAKLSAVFSYKWSCQGANTCGGYGHLSFEDTGTYSVVEGLVDSDESPPRETQSEGTYFFDGNQFIYLCPKGGEPLVARYVENTVTFNSQVWEKEVFEDNGR